MSALDLGRAISELVAQHASLRVLMDHCEDLADELDASHGPPEPLLDRVGELRRAFDAHNLFEEQLLRPALRAAGASAPRIDGLFDDHIGEHRAMRDRIIGSPITAELRGVIASLRAHLAAEERFLFATTATPATRR